MAEAVTGSITVTVPVSARSKSSFDGAIEPLAEVLAATVRMHTSEWPIGTEVGEATVVVSRTRQVFEPVPEPVEATPVSATKKSAKKKSAAKKKSRRTAH